MLANPQSTILLCAVAWFAIVAGIVAWCRRSPQGGVGLPIVYIAIFSMIHSGALIYLLPWYDPSSSDYLVQSGVNATTVAAGFAISTLGIASFFVGLVAVDNLLPMRAMPRVTQIRDPKQLARRLIILGAGFFFVVAPIAKYIPSGSSIASVGYSLAVIGIVLGAVFQIRQSTSRAAGIILAALTLPLITIVSIGFVGYGIAALLTVVGTVIKFIRWRWWFVPALALWLWAGLSFYVNYMPARQEMRDRVWGGAPFEERFEFLIQKAQEAEFFDPFENRHLHLIDNRLNQNALVGRSMYYIEESQMGFAYGESLKSATIAWIPRLIWPDKPTYAGSGTFVSQYTGLTFGKGTSVGLGCILEFYLNFGLTGVVCGCALIAGCLRFVDRLAFAHLRTGSYLQYVRLHLVGIAMLQPGGMIAEIVGSCAAATVLGITMSQLFGNRQRIDRQIAQAKHRPGLPTNPSAPSSPAVDTTRRPPITT